MKKNQKNIKTLFLVVSLLLLISFALNIFFGYKLYFLKNEYTDNTEINVLELYEIPTFLRGYRETGFVNAFIPSKNPFGGESLDYTEVTAGYYDPEYLKMFGVNHTGIDLVPSSNYYQKSTAYFRSRVPVVFSTINGQVNYLYDEFGANYLVITNNLENLRILFVHLEASFVKTGDRVVAGQPVGIMGKTGKATGKHLHYEVQKKDANGTWVSENPINYIN